MTPLLLSDEELQALTGADRPRAIAAWLTSRGWIFETDRTGRPKVARAYFEARMLGIPLPGRRVGPRTDFLLSS